MRDDIDSLDHLYALRYRRTDMILGYSWKKTKKRPDMYRDSPSFVCLIIEVEVSWALLLGLIIIFYDHLLWLSLPIENRIIVRDKRSTCDPVSCSHRHQRSVTLLDSMHFRAARLWMIASSAFDLIVIDAFDVEGIRKWVLKMDERNFNTKILMICVMNLKDYWL